MPSIRAEAADGLVWDHVSALLLNPRCLLEGLRARAEEAEEAVKPLNRELIGVEEAIRDQDRKLKKLLDGYLEDKLPRELLVEKHRDLERQKASLQRRQNDLQARLNAAVITEETIVSVEDFCQQISMGLERVTFEDKRRILELLSVEGIVEWEGDHPIKISGYFPEDVLTVGDNVFKGSGFYVTDNRNDGGGKKKPSEKGKDPENEETAD